METLAEVSYENKARGGGMDFLVSKGKKLPFTYFLPFLKLMHHYYLLSSISQVLHKVVSLLIYLSLKT